MFCFKTSIFLRVICCYLAFATCTRSLRPEDNENKCTHGGILNGVFLHGGIQSRNDTIFSNVSNMDECIAKCCRTSKCDLAMKIDKVCHAVNCQGDASCQISHKRKGTELRAEISFITKGETVKQETAKTIVKPLPQNRKESFQQSVINKKPTSPVFQRTTKTTTKATKFVPILQQTRQEIHDPDQQEVGSGSGTGSGSLNDESEKSGSGLETDQIKKLSKSISKTQAAVEEADGSNLVGLESSLDVGDASPEAIIPNSKLPSASRSAIPTPSKLGQSLVQSLKGYSFADNVDEDDDADGINEESQTLNAKENKGNDDDDDSIKAKADIEYGSSGKASRTDYDVERSHKVTTVKQIKTTEAKSNVEAAGSSKKSQSINHIENDNSKPDIANFVLSNLKSAVSEMAKPTKAVSGYKSITENKVPSRSGYDKVLLENSGATASHMGSPSANSATVGGYDQGSTRDEEAGSGVKGRERVSAHASDAGTISIDKSDQPTTNSFPNNTAAHDYKSTTRGTISGLPAKTTQRSVSSTRHARRKSFSGKKTKSSELKKKQNVTPLQKQLSTLFAKNAKNLMPSTRSYKKPSRKAAFEKVRRLQRQRERIRHHDKSQSLSLLYTRKSDKDKVKFIIHRFNDWRGWRRDQWLNVPRESAKCKRGVTIRGATLRGGILAGDFKTVGIVSNQHACVNSCCKNKRCDVALMLGKECFNVKCYSTNLCGIAPAAAIFDEVTPIITYVRGHIRKRSTDSQEESDDIPEEAVESLQLLRWLKIFI